MLLVSTGDELNRINQFRLISKEKINNLYLAPYFIIKSSLVSKAYVNLHYLQ